LGPHTRVQLCARGENLGLQIRSSNERDLEIKKLCEYFSLNIKKSLYLQVFQNVFAGRWAA
jgi:hypothetical protein